MSGAPAGGPGRSRLAILALLRGRIRASELWLVVIAAGVGALSGLMTVAVGAGAHGLQSLLYGLDAGERLSAIAALPAARLAVLPLGGLLLGGVTFFWVRRRPRTVVDPVEANALRGGRMSARDSAFVGVQSLISNGFGASVGLEAAYVQLGSGLASLTGGALNLRRSDLRAFVGAGAGRPSPPPSAPRSPAPSTPSRSSSAPTPSPTSPRWWPPPSPAPWSAGRCTPSPW